jgi:hypothetical protein
MEKYDGLRVYWDGKQLHSKGIRIDIPPSLEFPSIPFEGVLW